MTCEEVRPLLDAYADGELDVPANARVAAHLGTCAACRAGIARVDALRDALRAAAPAQAAPAPLEARIRSALAGEARPRRVWAARARRWAAVPLAAMLAAAAAWITTVDLTRPAGRDHLVDELVAGHVRALMVDHLVDVASTDQHTVRPWFNGKIDFAPPVTDFTAAGFPLVGGRVDYIDGRAVAVLVYRRHQHLVNIFIWPAAGAEEPPEPLAAQGYHLLRWQQAGLAYAAISDLNAAEMATLADLVRGERS